MKLDVSLGSLGLKFSLAVFVHPFAELLDVLVTLYFEHFSDLLEHVVDHLYSEL